MKRICLLLVLGAWSSALASGDEPEDISEQLEGLLEGSKVPSLAAAAVLDGEVMSRGAAGIRKLGDDTEVTVGDKYHIGSCTKSMTAVLAAMMVEKGELKWDTTVSEVFEDVKIHKGYRGVTLRQLVTNSGGAPGDVPPLLWGALWGAKGDPPDQRMRLVNGILSQPPAYPPGSKQLYSNAGFAIAGAMIETVADKAYEELLTEMLFEPLSMDSGGFRAPATKGKTDQPYGHAVRDAKVVAEEPEPRGDNPVGIAPAGAVHCSIGDLAKYAVFHLGGGDGELLTEESLELLHTPAEGGDYAMGWIVHRRPWAGGKALMHSGSNTTFYAVIWLAPEKGFAAVAACNLGGDEAFMKCDEAIGLLIKKHL